MSFVDDILAFRDQASPGLNTPARVPIKVRSLQEAVEETWNKGEGLSLSVNFQSINYTQSVFQTQSRSYGRTNFYFGTDDAGYNEDVLVLNLSGTSGDIRRWIRPLNRPSESARLPPDYEDAMKAAQARLKSIYDLSRISRQPKFFVPESDRANGSTKFLGRYTPVKGRRTFNWVHLLLATPLTTPPAPSTEERVEGEGHTYIPLRGFFSQPVTLQEQAQQVGFVNFSAQFTVLGAPDSWFFGRYTQARSYGDRFVVDTAEP